MAVLPTGPAHPAGTAAVERTAPATSAAYAPVDGAPQAGPDSASTGPSRIAPSTQPYETSAPGTEPSIPVRFNQHGSNASFAAAAVPCWVEHGST